MDRLERILSDHESERASLEDHIAAEVVRIEALASRLRLKPY